MMQKAIFVVLLAQLGYYYFSNYVTYRNHREILTDTVHDEYDYIVVGGGTAGSVVAARLAEDESSKVLLLEAGGFYDENPMFRVPLYYLELLNTTHDWKFYTEPQTASSLGLKEQRSFWPRGRVLGGTGIINGLQYTRGCRHEYDAWAANGCDGWSYREILPYFLKSEDMQIEELKDSSYHNTGGYVGVSGGRVTELSDLFMKAGEELGYEVNDYNGAKQEGFSRVQTFVRNGERESTGLAYLGRVGKRSNLDIVINTFVTKINIHDNRAVGVTYIRNGIKSHVKARKEVIVSAGVVNTVKLMMLSGIGPREHLESMNIPVIADLPVGNNLQDHQLLCLFSKINKSISITDDLVNSPWTRLQYSLFGTGPLSIPGTDGSSFFYLDKTSKEKRSADIQTILISKFLNKNYFNFKDEIAKEYLAEHGNVEGFNFLISVTHPKSTGTIRLRSTDPFDYPIIDPQYLTVQDDVDAFIGGIRIWERYLETPTMRSMGADSRSMKMSFCSQHEFRSDKYWECFVRHLALTVYHHSAACKMGAASDPTAVVDPQLRVKGIKGLRIVDTSVFPNVTSGNTNAPMIMIAEKVSDMIRGIDSVKHIREKLPKDI